MKALDKRIWRALLEHKAQYLGSLLIIALSAAAYTMMSHFALNFERLVAEFQVSAVQEDAAFSTREPIDDEELAALEAVGGAMIEATPVLDAPIAAGKTLRLLGLNQRINLPAIVEGRALQGRGELLVDPVFAAANEVKVGDTVTIFDRPFAVVGFMALPHIMYPLEAETDMMPRPSFGFAVIGREDLAALGKPIGTVHAVKFDPSDEPIRARAIAFRQRLERRGIELVEWTNTEDNKRVNIVAAEVQILKIVSLGAPTAMLLLACVMVGSVMRRMLARDEAVIGALYALGLRRSEIQAHYLAYPLLLAVVGGVVGTVVGILPVRGMVSFFVGTFTVPLTGIELVPARVAINLLLPVVFLLASGYLVLRKRLGLPPAELMKGRREGTKVNPLERALQLRRLGFATRFKIRGQLRSLPRLALLLVGVATSTVLLQWGFSLRTSMDFLLTAASDVYAFEYEYKLVGLRSDPLPAGAEPFSAALFLPEGEESRDFHVVGIPPDSALVVLRNEAGERLSTDQVIITKPLAKLLRAERGARVDIVGKVDGREHAVTIDEVADSFAGSFMFMPLPRYNAQFGLPEGSYNGAFSSVPIELPEGVAHSVTTLDDKAAGARATMDAVEGMMGMVVFMAFGIGLVVLYVVTAQLVEENKGTISLMKIVGYRRKEIDALVLSSSTITVIIGYLLGIPLTHVALGVLVDSFEASVGMVLPRPSIGPAYIVGGFVIVMLAYQLSKWLCRRRVSVVSMRDALQGE